MKIPYIEKDLSSRILICWQGKGHSIAQKETETEKQTDLKDRMVWPLEIQFLRTVKQTYLVLTVFPWKMFQDVLRRGVESTFENEAYLICVRMKTSHARIHWHIEYRIEECIINQ